MQEILGMLDQVLSGDTARRIGQALGTDERTAGTAVQAGVKTLVAALAKNAARPEGAEALARAVQRDHDGSLLDRLPEALARPETLAKDGEGILRHVLGGRKPAVEAGLSQATGVAPEKLGQVLSMIAPVVLGALGKKTRERQLDPGRLAEMLDQERRAVEEAEPEGAGLLSRLLDADGDGQIGDDLSRMGQKFLGKLFGGR